MQSSISTPGSRLKAARQKIGLTQTGVAERLSQSVETYKGWEQDRARPRSYLIIKRLCTILHITIDHYIGGAENSCLAPDESCLLHHYRTLPQEGKDALNTILDLIHPPPTTDTKKP
ncbi:Transcriptional regulator, contains XRE-family HTH domain [Amphritea atlantica]|uniref:Transcriptional regulator, contains XRE-family HTH domain n=1 Tax=Amphritea atlantica TaxID=355243 RepID=A0A1H9GFC4_9GAMM|nr:helix-turn-helix transcriptional regulator [Amphritea atlantica]SEQ48528.1 Transcriptional regulator, contains XRE-family HTH domain [Amphritea atlantica]